MWNREVFGDIKKKKAMCLEEIQKWDKLEDDE